MVHIYPQTFVDGTKVGGVSKIDFDTKTVTCFDPEGYDSTTKTFGKREVRGHIAFCIDADMTSWPEHRYFYIDGTNVIR